MSKEDTTAAKMFKVSYKINIMPMIDEYITVDKYGHKTVVNSGYSFFERCIESDELDIFDVANF